ncbi:MAG: hypothetical protein OJF52_004600 [Nitrospira sp.]|nr:MAG: hypothetical protein OJF52_004600 [Nitrospira sp.]
MQRETMIEVYKTTEKLSNEWKQSGKRRCGFADSTKQSSVRHGRR